MDIKKNIHLENNNYYTNTKFVNYGYIGEENLD